MKIKWNPSARADMRQVARYVNKKFGRKARQEFMQRVRDGVAPDIPPKIFIR